MPKFEARVAGIYRATYTGCTQKTFVNQETGEDETRLLWIFQEVNDATTTGEISKFTGTSLKSPKANAHIIAAGIVGRKLQPGDDTETHIGEVYDVVYGPNQAGNLTITSVVRVAAGADAPAPAVLPVAPAAEVAELP